MGRGQRNTATTTRAVRKRLHGRPARSPRWQLRRHGFRLVARVGGGYYLVAR
jgi:hypothetical protein